MTRVNGPRQEHSQSCDPDGCEISEAAASINGLLNSLIAQFDLAMPRPEQVENECEKLRQILGDLSRESVRDHLLRLSQLLAKRVGRMAAPIFSLLADAAGSCQHPWPFLEPMLTARDQDLVHRALDITMNCAETGALFVDLRVVGVLAACAEAEESALNDAIHLGKVARILEYLVVDRCECPDNLLFLYLMENNLRIRRLAARLLDLPGEPVPQQLIEQLVGQAEAEFLQPYFEYTRAGYQDLLHVLAASPALAPLLQSLRQAESICGRGILKDAIARLGWARLTLGLEVRHLIGMSVAGSFPLLVTPAEASLLEACGDTYRGSESFLFISHGGMRTTEESTPEMVDPVARFRSYNILHAEALADILTLAPLTGEKVERILDRMDRIVQGFLTLFSSYANECAILPEIYEGLKQRIRTELKKESALHQLSAELTRLVQMFEEPRTIGEVRTLHGLKRYLHQTGLRLGMRLVGPGQGTNRTIDLLVVSRSRPSDPVRRIRYVDFEPQDECASGGAKIPYPVTLLAEGFSRQLLTGQQKFPDVRIFCYGNEVHYYLSFGNHPAFLRIDYSPPLQGGMIDLEYYGVSKYEMALHPNPDLHAIRQFFRHFDFQVQVEQTRIHARFDKERAIDLGSICEKAEALFRFVPYLMEVDWIIGNLDLDANAKAKVAAAWAEFLGLWGSLPISQILSSDRRGILMDIEHGATADQEVLWPGEGAYRDRISILPLMYVTFARIRALLGRQGVSLDYSPDHTDQLPVGQLDIEAGILVPIREALFRGELITTPEGIRLCPGDLFRRLHATEIFAEMIGSQDESLPAAARLAVFIAPLERTLRFHTTGYVNGNATQEARLCVAGETLGLYVLRNSDSIARLAIFARGCALYQHRERPSDSWKSSWSHDGVELASLLRRANYLAPVADTLLGPDSERTAQIREEFRFPNPNHRPKPIPGEKVVTGVRASPGRAVGTARFSTSGVSPVEFEGAVLVASSVRPEDTTFLYHAAGIASTGGGILSHAGLIALQFHKPALIISGEWISREKGNLTLAFRTVEYREEEREVHGLRVTIFRDPCECRHFLHEGDLTVLDADEGILRSLGQGIEPLALHKNFQAFGAASRRLGQLSDGKDILTQRGQRIRARHKIGRLLSRIVDPILACHAVQEITSGSAFTTGVSPGEKACFLSVLLGNPDVGQTAREYLLRMATQMVRKCRFISGKAERQIPMCNLTHEVLSLRLEVLRLLQSLTCISALVEACGISVFRVDPATKPSIDAAARNRLTELYHEHLSKIGRKSASGAEVFRSRHLLRQAERLDLVLGAHQEGQESMRRLRDRLAVEDDAALRRCAGQRIVIPQHGGLELYPLIGWKAANLAEVERLADHGMVPPWFVITHRAFEEALDSPLGRIPEELGRLVEGAGCPRMGIDAILARRELDLAQKSACIRSLWESVILSPALIDEIVIAYHNLFGSFQDEPSSHFVAVRSSAREEDAEIAARAGEFQTFLCVRGDQSLIEHLRRAWSGLWTDRAIHNRTIFGCGGEAIGGGVIVQAMVCPRVAGVLQTCNASECEQSQIVINAGLGLGEGIVSGTVAADQIVVSKENDCSEGALHFRYITADKREQVVFDKHTGSGTTRVETLYHQRLRPALEYVELCDLVKVARRLESDYGYALDIEFAIEGTRLWILQARPISSFIATLRETLDKHPLFRVQ